MARQQLSVGNYKYRTDKIENNIKQEDKAGTVRETSGGTCCFLFTRATSQSPCLHETLARCRDNLRNSRSMFLIVKKKSENHVFEDADA